MKRAFLIIFWAVVVAMAFYQSLTIPAVRNFFQKIFSLAEIRETMAKRPQRRPPPDPVTLTLKNGAIVSGQFLREDREAVTIFWEGGEVTFARNEIEQLEKGKYQAEKEGLIFPEATSESWPHKNSVLIHLTNQTVLDEKIAGVEKESIIIRRELEEGGVIEQSIPPDPNRISFF
ncbi:MAG: hypothetical protein ABH845_02005 [Candidatus Omnitrophota bacterium]